MAGCSGSSADHSGDPRDNTPHVLEPVATGDAVYGNGEVSIDASNTSEGYVMVKSSNGGDVIVKLENPAGDEYTYYLKTGDYQTLPLTSGNGKYNVQVLNGIGGNSYVMAYSTPIDVSIDDEFKPFLYPNQYAFFTKDSAAVGTAKELAYNTWNDIEVVENVYEYVIKTIKYDEDKASSVSTGYIPNVDSTLDSGKGICFDYASVMTAMLRSQGIPTKLEVGYAGEAYHAWISTYLKDIGWVDNVIQFDGESWSIMDPTLAANNDKDAVKKYVGDGSNYFVKYSY